MNEIKFYRTREEHGYLSNFWSKDPFAFEGHEVKTSEALFQALKHNKTNPTVALKILKEPHPGTAASMGRDRTLGLRTDWDNVKDDAMRITLMAKFCEGTSFYDKFLSTDGQILIEDSPIDWYWGCGKDGAGKNVLGVLLMEWRDFLINGLKEYGYTGLGLEGQQRFNKLIKAFAGEDGKIFAPNFDKPYRGY